MKKQLIQYFTLLLFGSISVWSCIEPYDLPGDTSNFVSSLVIEGNINNSDSIQLVTISQTSAINSPDSYSVNGLVGCEVVVTDAKGHIFEFRDIGQGKYTCIITKSFFYSGNSFSLRVNTPDSKEYVSEEEKLLPVSPIDSVYMIPVYDDNYKEVGVQFMVDINAGIDDCRNYKWKLVETYEYHSNYPIQFIYTGDTANPEVRNSDMSQYRCYTTRGLKGSNYIASTENLSENKFLGIDLNTVSYSSNMLFEKYSLLVKQYSLTANAAQFWSQLKSMHEEADMFDGQPVVIEGNIRNEHNSEERVLGFFGASMVSEKRIFAERPSNTGIYDCATESMNEFLLDSLALESSPLNPLYVMIAYAPSGEIFGILTAPEECFDCTVRGGGTTKPDYWDNEDIVFLRNVVE